MTNHDMAVARVRAAYDVMRSGKIAEGMKLLKESVGALDVDSAEDVHREILRLLGGWRGKDK